MKIKCNPHDDLPLKKTLFFMKAIKITLKLS